MAQPQKKRSHTKFFTPSLTEHFSSVKIQKSQAIKVLPGDGLGAIRPLVLAGLPTTRTITDFLAYFSRLHPGIWIFSYLLWIHLSSPCYPFFDVEPTSMATTRCLRQSLFYFLSVAVTSFRRVGPSLAVPLGHHPRHPSWEEYPTAEKL